MRGRGRERVISSWETSGKGRTRVGCRNRERDRSNHPDVLQIRSVGSAWEKVRACYRPGSLSSPGVRSSASRLCPVILLAALVGCRGGTPARPEDPNSRPEVPDGPAWFEDITDRAGLNFVHDPGDAGQYLMYQSIGSGCAVAD